MVDSKGKWVLILAVTLGLVLFVHFSFLDSRSDASDICPKFTLKNLDNRTLSSASFPNKTHILHFWASWCDMCVPELWQLIKLVDMFGDNLKIIAIHEGAGRGDIVKLRRLIRKTGLKYDIIFIDDGRVADIFGVESVPVSILVDSKGKIVKRFTGVVNWGRPEVIEMVKDVIGKR